MDDEILELVEALAEHVHDQWAQIQITLGWTYGPTDLLTHKCLVPRLSREEHGQ